MIKGRNGREEEDELRDERQTGIEAGSAPVSGNDPHCQDHDVICY